MRFHWGSILEWLWLIPALPLLAAGLGAILKQRHRRAAASLAISSMVLGLLLSAAALAQTIFHPGAGPWRQTVNFRWLQYGDTWLRLGWVLDPLSAVMLVVVTFVGLIIFIYSLGYMAQDRNFTRFFCFLSLFSAAMLGLVIANSLLLLFMCWELVGLTSYLLIGFWYEKPRAAAAAKKAFIVTRVGDLALLLGLVWLYAETGTLLFYDDGNGCLDSAGLDAFALQVTRSGFAISTGVGLLIFCGAIGKSGQVPLHVWLPDAMEGPTPVSALIHAATMVAAGVFLVARTYPLMALAPGVLQVVSWTGVITAVFAATVALAQSDIKRILAYSTVSQLGFMMMGLGTGGAAVGMFHLVTHACFKALLFLGAGSVIHGCHEEQDIRRLGGLRKQMPVTFATYAIGMLALSGVPIFAGFWSKDAILHAAHAWRGGHAVLYLGIFAAFLTAIYMTRQMIYVFFGRCRLGLQITSARHPAGAHMPQGSPVQPHESPAVMTVPLVILAVGSTVLGFIGTPAWEWLQAFLDGRRTSFELRHLAERGVWMAMLTSVGVAVSGILLGCWWYGRGLGRRGEPEDAFERRWPDIFHLLRGSYYLDEIFDWALVGLCNRMARLSDWLDRWVWAGAIRLVSSAVWAVSWLSRLFDEYALNAAFDHTCRKLVQGGGALSRLQDGRVQHYLRLAGLGLGLLMIFLIWGCRAK